MKCINCGLPLSPARTLTNCPRCGAPLNSGQEVQQQQFEQRGWGTTNMGGRGAPQENPWVQVGSTAPPQAFFPQGMQNQPVMGGQGNRFNGSGRPEFQSSPLSTKRPYPPQNKPKNSRNLFMVAGLCVIVGALLLVLIVVLGSGGSNPQSSTTANNNPTSNSSTSLPQTGTTPTPTPTTNAEASPTASASPSVTGTAYPGQQYISDAQMAQGVDNKTMQPQQPTTTFPVGSNMYVIFNLHPPSQGGAVCSLWYLNGNPNPITSYSFNVSGSSTASYTYATYGSPGQAYVELYWASDKSCSDKVLAQHVDFTVTAS